MNPREEVLIGAAAALRASGLRFVDATWFLDPARKGEDGFFEAHIPGAVFFDIDAICDERTALPHMLPHEEDFARAAGALGLTEHDPIVVYDQTGLSSAPRVWWTFKIFGARSVKVLDGGLPAWKAAGGAVAVGPASPRPALFSPRFERRLLATSADVERAIEDGMPIVDGRPADRFSGRQAEPRPGLRSGHMPGAVSLPASRLVDGGRLAPPRRLLEELDAAGITSRRPVITTCGSGVAAATLSLALASLGRASSLYDGSWAEWGREGAGRVERE